jgi:hypothetical protein
MTALRSDAIHAVARIHPDAGEIWLRAESPIRPDLCAELARGCRPHGQLLEVRRPAGSSTLPWNPL